MNDIKSQVRQYHRQTGYMLLEVLISILLFAIGILGTVATLAVVVRSNSDATYRIDASFLANALFAHMWADNRNPATLQNDYQTDGTKYTKWVGDVQARLPGADLNPPTVVFAAGTGAVTTTLFWQLPGDSAVHRYVATTNIR
jgi:type IV pilus assembly protein PilV